MKHKTSPSTTTLRPLPRVPKTPLGFQHELLTPNSETFRPDLVPLARFRGQCFLDPFPMDFYRLVQTTRFRDLRKDIKSKDCVVTEVPLNLVLTAISPPRCQSVKFQIEDRVLMPCSPFVLKNRLTACFRQDISNKKSSFQ